MTDYTIRKLDDVPDAFGGQYPGTMRFLTEPLGNRAGCVHPPGDAAPHRRQELVWAPAQDPGGEEIYYVISGRPQLKLGVDELRANPGENNYAEQLEAVAPCVDSVFTDGLYEIVEEYTT